MSPLPIAHDPGGISLHVGVDLVLLELAAGILLRRSSKTDMSDIIDALLLPASHDHGARIYFDPQILDSRQRTRDLLTPGSAFAGNPCFLRPSQRRKARRRKQSQSNGQPDALYPPFQLK